MQVVQVVIGIDENSYKAIKRGEIDYYDALNGLKAIANGASLPEHHGRLIDANKINLHNISPCDDEMLSVYGATVEDIEETPTVIVADAEECE